MEFTLNGRPIEVDLSKAVEMGPAGLTLPDLPDPGLSVGQALSIEGVRGRVTRLTIEEYPEPIWTEWAPGEWYWSRGSYVVEWVPL